VTANGGAPVKLGSFVANEAVIIANGGFYWSSQPMVAAASIPLHHLLPEIALVALHSQLKMLHRWIAAWSKRWGVAVVVAQPATCVGCGGCKVLHWHTVIIGCVPDPSLRARPLLTIAYNFLPAPQRTGTF